MDNENKNPRNLQEPIVEEKPTPYFHTFNFNLFYNQLAIEREFNNIEAKVIVPNILSDQYVTDVKFSTKYIGKHNYVRIRFNHITNIYDVYIQFNTDVINKNKLTMDEAVSLIIDKI